MDHLIKVRTFDEMYSKEYNQILIKTPPSLFKTGLLIFSFALILIFLAGYFLKFDKIYKFSAIGKVSEGDNFIISATSEKNDIVKFVNFPKAIKFNDKKLQGSYIIEIDSVKTSEILYYGNEVINLDKLDLKLVDNVNKIKVKYLYTFHGRRTENSSPTIMTGDINLIGGKERLYKLIFSK